MNDLNIYMAPMEGLTGHIYRNAYEKYFGKGKIAKYFMPFISPNKSERFLAKEKRDIDSANNIGLVAIPQVMTNKASDFIWTAKYLYERYGYTEINLNAGCPSATVVSKYRGSGILRELKVLDDFFCGIYEDSYITDNNIKVSVKTRLGMEFEEEFEDILGIYNKYPLHELIVHPRVREDFYKNTPKFEGFKYALDNSRCPVCYNGDIFTLKDFVAFREKFPEVNTIMLGRGLIADPGLINVIKSDNPKEYVRDLKQELVDIKGLHDEVYAGYNEIMDNSVNAMHRVKEMWCYMEYLFDKSNEKEILAIKKSRKQADYRDAIRIFFNKAVVTPKESINFNRKF